MEMPRLRWAVCLIALPMMGCELNTTQLSLGEVIVITAIAMPVVLSIAVIFFWMRDSQSVNDNSGNATQVKGDKNTIINIIIQNLLQLFQQSEVPGKGASKVRKLRKRASKALNKGELQRAREYLSAAEKLDIEAFEQLESAARQRRSSAAESTATRATIEKLQINPASYSEAARLYGLAAGYVDSVDAELARKYRKNQADVLYELGDEFGDNEALQEAIDLLRRLVTETDRRRDAEDWARIQNSIGNALRILGERESGTAHLEEAVAAYRAALEEYTRKRVPLDWAMTQNNLGAVLQTLGERESGTAHLEEAVAAYRAALEEYTRERVPLDWAGTQNNLGVVLQTLGGRESGTARLEEAVAACHAALEVYELSGTSHYANMARRNLARAEALLAAITGKAVTHNVL